MSHLLDTPQRQEAHPSQGLTLEDAPEAAAELRLEAAALRDVKRASARKDRARAMVAIGVVSSLAGSVLAALFSIDDVNGISAEVISDALVPTLLMSLTAMFLVITLYRFRERQLLGGRSWPKLTS